MESTETTEKKSYWRTLSSRERLGWVLYDWANSAFTLCVITVIGSAYFVGLFETAAKEAGGARVGPALSLPVGGVAFTAEAAWAFLIGLSMLFVAVTSPFLGAIADALGKKKRFLQVYCTVGVAATLALFFPMPWWVVGLLIVLGNIGFEGGNVYYNAFLPEIVPVEDQDQVSSAAYALGYIGGVIVLIAILVLFTDTVLAQPVGSIRYAFILVGLWWGGFGWITFSLLREYTAARAGDAGAASGPGVLGHMAAAWRELKSTVGNISRVPQAALFLLAFLLYNDGIATLISNVTPFALQNIYLDAAKTQPITQAELIMTIIMIQLIAFPSAILFGWLATRIGEKATLYITLAVYTGVVSFGQVVTQIGEFYWMAAAVGLVLGGSQAISRSLFASFIPQGKSAEFFAFFAFSSKFSAMAGPFIYGGLLLLTGDTRLSLLSLTVFFVAGGAVLYFVDVEKGRADALREG